MRVDDFDFDLPQDRIALRPAEPRDAARLLRVRPGHTPMLADHVVADLPSLLRPGDALVFNDTKVIPARLAGVRLRGDLPPVAMEATLHRRLDPSRWAVFAKPGRRIAPGDRLVFSGTGQGGDLTAQVVTKDADGFVTLAFDRAGPALDEAVVRIGHVPLPPYIAARRPDDARDRRDYQTIYAREGQSVAAPTAGLHFTEGLLARLQAHDISMHFLTLNVGAGTFLPVKVADTADHRMHAEYALLTPQTADALNAVRARGGRIVAVGTTAMRTLESAVDGAGIIRPCAAETAIFITPGFRFRAVDLLMTNFHLPRSTLFMLVSAFCGLDVMRAAYWHAIDTGYRFYSYGDASLLEPAR
jgi:S-adenosylmethionine:tRNA ribosyltransferase-isomerase